MTAGDALGQRLGHAEPFYRYVPLIWLFAMALLAIPNWTETRAGSLGDPDNYMRMVQVRDWLNGQPWSDVTQYRMNLPAGGDLHWSRLVDLPIALVIVLLRPLVGQPMADVVALVAVPALLCLALMLVMGCLLRDIAGREVALLMLALLPACLMVGLQFAPMRVDHHGWQLLMAACALLAWTRPGRWPAVGCALACAVWMHVSIEGLPYAALFAGLYALAFVRTGDRRIHLFMAALIGASLLLILGTRGAGLIVESHCDAISAPYIAALFIAGAMLFLIDSLLRPANPAMRLVPLIVGGAGAAAAVVLIAPACLAGPFAGLDPLVRDYWYYSVREGLPFWRQGGAFATLMILAPLPGVIAAMWRAWACRRSHDATTWLGLALAAAFAWLLGMTVMRATAVAELYALPGMAAAIMLLAGQRHRFRPRIGWSLTMAGTLLLSTALPAYGLGQMLFPPDKGSTDARTDGDCPTAIASPKFKSLGSGQIFAPIDMGPLILYRTDLSIVAAGYHRNSAAMATVIRAFTAKPDEARAIVLATPAQYLLLCPTAPEARNYLKAAPHGLAASLTDGQVPPWLVSDDRLQQPGARLYRILH
ncbi:hypothetical protein [Sphingobium sp. B11D3D]|uniref:hypothetical protein n=1 Tax=Sphingobium sp. B11D3D TaxID=2940576 RepID=UPI002223FBF5|nr:hypothetical protein [Sphingobium sp. B11D3D]MCW2367920.1 hypothetical protein [Sphingobium sp. B11D3D]